jgi:hypothetical protein
MDESDRILFQRHRREHIPDMFEERRHLPVVLCDLSSQILIGGEQLMQPQKCPHNAPKPATNTDGVSHCIEVSQHCDVVISLAKSKQSIPGGTAPNASLGHVLLDATINMFPEDDGYAGDACGLDTSDSCCEQGL